ncbi:Macrophage-expressed protein 1 protein [Clonorchis sinensis]|uniref:Macrophage-expressed protein 1 protein n=1 Tax=Clonorchis sinensis TaxID=79923 RepID=A0A8T1MWG0_CLOSI|nr:Macrophage-expressed protein 1 protein [Clonorchis sinensis]
MLACRTLLLILFLSGPHILQIECAPADQEPKKLPSVPTEEQCKLKVGERLLQVLPGVGWDNLVNEERGPTIDRDVYSQCRRSSDGRYVVPDDMVVEPKKSSDLDLSSEVYESGSSCTSLTAASINSAMDVGLSYYQISGDFSFEKESIRQQSSLSKGLIVRTQLRHKRYTVRLLPDSTPHPRFRNRLLDIAAHLRRGNVTVKTIDDFDKGGIEPTSRSGVMPSAGAEILAIEEAMSAFHLADLLVRDYGTHSLISVDAGGILVKTDTLDENSQSYTKAEREKLASHASASFASMLKVSIGGSFTSNESVATNYGRKVSHSRVTSYGGPIFQANELSLSKWESGLDDELVVIDRSGVPIYELISSRSLPELDEEMIGRLTKTIRSAITRYYTANAVIGCMDPSSAYYDIDANVDSAECRGETATISESARLPLGGVYQKCQGPAELCDTLAVKNAATGDFTCPTGYLSVQLLPPQVRTCTNHCERSVWHGAACQQECATTELHWCSLDPTVPEPPVVDGNIGFIFGGLYTDKEPNPLTQQYSCPEYSWPVAVGRRMRICLSSDRELSGKHAMLFGGFYSCRFGNPLVSYLEQNETNPKQRSAISKPFNRSILLNVVEPVNVQARSSLDIPNDQAPLDDYSSLFASIWPKRCPSGYTTHLASMEDTCQVNFCVPANTIKVKKKRYLKRPPFVAPPTLYSSSGSAWAPDSLLDPPSSMAGSKGETLERVDGTWTRSGAIGLQLDYNKDGKWLRQVNIILGSVLAIFAAAVIVVGVFLVLVCRRRGFHAVPTS